MSEKTRKYIVIANPVSKDALKAKADDRILVSAQTFSMVEWAGAEVCGVEYYAKKAESLGAKIVGDIIKAEAKALSEDEEKEAMEIECKKLYGVDLKKSKSLVNMQKDFEAAKAAFEAK